MPQYEYKCRECSHYFTELHSMSDRTIPVGNPCPECGAEGSIYQTFTSTPSLVSDTKSTLTRAGSEWGDVLKKVKKASGRQNSIHD